MQSKPHLNNIVSRKWSAVRTTCEVFCCSHVTFNLAATKEAAAPPQRTFGKYKIMTLKQTFTDLYLSNNKIHTTVLRLYYLFLFIFSIQNILISFIFLYNIFRKKYIIFLWTNTLAIKNMKNSHRILNLQVFSYFLCCFFTWYKTQMF